MTLDWPLSIVVSVMLVACGCDSSDASTVPHSEAATPDHSEADTATTTARAATTTAPTGAHDFTAVAEALDQARLRWSDAGITSYELTISEHRNFWSQGCTWISVVTDGVVTATDLASTSPTSPNSPAECFESEWTVERLHAMVSSMLDDVHQFAAPEFGEHTLRVRFNESGVPETIEFDLANGADEEASMDVTFVELP